MPVQLECSSDAEACELVVTLEQVVVRRVSLNNIDQGTIALYLENVELSDADRTTLQRVLDLQRRISQLTAERRGVESRIATIHNDQNRSGRT